MNICDRCGLYEPIANVKNVTAKPELWCRACLIQAAQQIQDEIDTLTDELLERYATGLAAWSG
jgi:hypothetical protein